MLPENAAPILSQTFAKLLGNPERGSVAFVRCLPPDAARALAANPSFLVPGWRVAAVVEHDDRTERCITADQAVEIREDKGDAVLLLVDPGAAGAGMDGIYSAAREVGEKELFDAAQEEARQRLPHGFKNYAKKALEKARQVSRQRRLAPWSAFEFLCRAARQATEAGSALPVIGLWPIDVGARPDEADLDKATRLTERLLPIQGAKVSAGLRVAGLKLSTEQQETARQLESFLREAETLPRLEALARVEGSREFWLNRLRPGLFDEQTLQSIEWISWRGKSGKPQVWSGLIENDDARLELRLNPNAENPRERSRLEVRWKADPESLFKGAVDYVVEVRAGHGQEILAEKSVSHSGKSPQKAIFTQDDFDDVEENARFEAQVRIKSLGEDASEAISEDFVLCFGETDKPAKSSAGKVYPTLALAVAHLAPDAAAFKRLAKEPSNRQWFGSDARGYITCRWDANVAKVFCPPLLAQLGKDWVDRNGALGRWRLRVRADGTSVGSPEFIDMGDEPGADRLVRSSKQMALGLVGSQGPLGILYHHEGLEAINGYILAAMEVWKSSPPRLTLIHTLEVTSLSGRRLGFIVLPTHPLRVAWQQSFDLLVAHHRYEQELPAHKVQTLLEKVTGAHYPAFLPGLEPGESFVFADTLGFHAVALVPADDAEPKATVALLGRLLGGDESVAPTVGKGAAEALADEVRRYLKLHPDYHRIRVHALRAGDAMPVARALGHALQAQAEDAEIPEEDGTNRLCYELDLFPAKGQATELTGRFLSLTAERRRSGAGAVPETDRWLLTSVARPGGVSLPRLKWARRSEGKPSIPAHLAIAFDIFASRVECRPQTSLQSNGVLEAHGLMLMPTREFRADLNPHWLSFIPPAPEGEMHPVTAVLTKRQVNLHASILRLTAQHMGGGPEDWPVLVTEVSADQAELLQDLHALCDWVITADKNAGIEYFDSPQELPKVYESYIIDCVPERDDLGFMQLITSTSNFDEVGNLLDAALAEMGLSASPRNCRFLLEALKAVSGRLALRLAGAGSSAQEMIAVAMAHSHCAKATDVDEIWLPLSEGFFVPLDDVPELFRQRGAQTQWGEQRADLLYVGSQKRGGLRLAFVEVKFRRYLKTARAPDLTKMMDRQIDASCQRWDQLFGAKTSALEKTVNRAWLARILRFYARKGRRHGLSEDACRNAMREIDRLVRKESDLPDIVDVKRAGFVFCPEFGGREPAEIEHEGSARLWLFGPDLLPEPRLEVAPVEGSMSISTAATEAATPDSSPTAQTVVHVGTFVDEGGTKAVEARKPSQDVTEIVRPSSLEANIVLGHREFGEDPVVWHVSIRANPHLMILGLPGMGKTTCLINVCEQLCGHGITPIVFSYHQDIDEKLSSSLPKEPLVVRYAGLGFNPMRVESPAARAFLDNVGMLRDIFAAIFPDLGDVQLGRLREALKKSYTDKGWGLDRRGDTPDFRAFLDLLRSDPKPDKGLLTRLSELDDYGLFGGGTGAPTLLDTNTPALIQIHGTQNEYLQRAFATFVLYNLYQNMFRRGPQAGITHAVIFDEAHRAARLKLMPTMVKECRKYGIAFVVASQEAKDFDPSLFMAIANYLALRLNETDAKLMAKSFAASDKVGFYTDRIKQMPKYRAMYYGEGMRTPLVTNLTEHAIAK